MESSVINFNHTLLFFSGGTGVNPLAEALTKFTARVCYVIPTSDDGGSSAEIRRVVGGPAVGDIRSRLVRIAPSSDSVQELLHYRLGLDEESALAEWHLFLNGTHRLYEGVHPQKKQIIKQFLVYFHSHVLSSPLTEGSPFAYRNGSIGNFFFSGSRLFFNSIESAIFLFARVQSVPLESSVVPVIASNTLVCLAARLKDGSHVYGQNVISHPTLSKDPNEQAKLVSPIEEIYYTNEQFQVIHPHLNPVALETIRDPNSVVIYSMGSLYTSIVPCLIFPDLADAIARKAGPKILLLNGYHDRETLGLSAMDFVCAITRALNRCRRRSKDTTGENASELPLSATDQDYDPTRFVTHVFYVEGGSIPLSEEELARHAIRLVSVQAQPEKAKHYDVMELIRTLATLLSESNELERK